MTVSVRVISDVVILDVNGRMTVNRDGEPLGDHVSRWLARGHRHQLDLANVSYMDSTCLGEIVTAYQLLHWPRCRHWRQPEDEQEAHDEHMINWPSPALEIRGPPWPPSNASPLGAPRAAERAGPTILVVDSEPQTLSRTQDVLRVAGYRVATSETFEEAGRLLTSILPDILIADIRLGAFNGLHLVWRRRWDHPTHRSVVTSDTSDPVLQREARQLGAPYLVKPIRRDDLLRVVTELLASPNMDLSAHSRSN